MLAVEVHELDARNLEAGSFDDVSLHGGIGDVLGLDLAGGFDLGDDPGVAFFGERVDGDEDLVFEEAGFEDDGGAGRDGFSCLGDGVFDAAVVELDERGVGEVLTRAFADAVAHVEDGLEGGVGFQLRSARLVDLPPKLAVALAASGEAGFGEAARVA